MSYAITLRFEGVNEAHYWAVNEALGIDREGQGDWPEGLLVHSGGPVGDDGWVVSEIWASKADHEAWMAGRLGAALGAVGVPAPAQVIDTDPVHVHRA